MALRLYFSNLTIQVHYLSSVEQTPLDLSAAYGDFRVYDIIKTKLDSMPAPKDKKKGGKGGKEAKGGGKRPKSSASPDQKVRQ